MCYFTRLGDDSQVKIPAFGKLIGLIVCKKQANERNYFTSRFLRIGISRFAKRKFSAYPAALR